MRRYELTPASTSPEAIPEYARLLTRVFGGTRFTERFLRWQYLENPNGTVVGYDARAEGELVGHLACLPVAYSVAGRPVKTLLSLNVAMLREHQGQWVMSRIMRSTIAHARERGYDLIIAVANQNSTPFAVRVGLRLVGQLDVRIGVGSLDLRREHEQYAVRATWTDEARAWRLRNPLDSYVRRGNMIYGHSGKPGLYCVMGQLPTPGGRGLPLVGGKLWIGLASRRRSRGVFVPLPDRLRPVPLNLLAIDLVGTLPPFGRDDVYFELLDFDAF